MITVHNPTNLPLVKISEAIPVQGDLKVLTQENYDKLKQSILSDGFYLPIFVWKHDGDIYLLDGHSRQKVMEKEGWDVEVPYVAVEAEDYDEARRKILYISSQYGVITEDGFNDFVVGLEHLDISNIHFDALDYTLATDAFVDVNEEEDQALASMVDEKEKTYSLTIKAADEETILEINDSIRDVLDQYSGISVRVK